MSTLMTLDPPPLPVGWSPAQIHTDTAHPARVYDYLLGGKDNYPVDSAAAEDALAVAPQLREIARANRAFLDRALRAAVTQHGVRQLLDIGTGLPGSEHPAQVLDVLAPDSRAVFVDLDPIVLTHVQARLCHGAARAAVYGDLRDPAALLAQPALHAVLDLREPVALMLGFVLHHLPDHERPQEAVHALTRALAPGSILILSHATAEGQPQLALAAAECYQAADMPLTLRAPAQIAAFFDGLDMQEPGLVAQPWWRPDRETADDPSLNWGYGALAYKP